MSLVLPARLAPKGTRCLIRPCANKSTSRDALASPCGYTGWLKGYRLGWDLAPSGKGKRRKT
jgi:hypothetical protein